MDSEKQPTTFGVTIEQSSQPPTTPPPQKSGLNLIPVKESDSITAPPSAVSTPTVHTPNHTNPFSAFYEHRADSSNNLKTPNVYQHDLESQCQLSTSKISMDPGKECTMWPSRAALKAQKREEKHKKSWNPLHRLGKRQKLTAQIVIALLVIGAAVGIGVGVSRAVGGGVWSGNGQSKPIPKQTPDKST